MPCASAHLQLLSRGRGQRHRHIVFPPTALLPTTTTSTPHAWRLCSTHNAASRLDHGTNLRVRCGHCRHCATEPQRVAICSHCRRRVDVDEDEDEGEDKHNKVKSAGSSTSNLQPPISNLSRLAARLLLTKPPPYANALRDFPTQLLSQLLLASASARWPRGRMKKPQTANLPGLPLSRCKLHNN